MNIAVVTVVAGRHEHLRVQRRHLAASTRPADLHVVVSLDDAGVAAVVAEQGGLPSVVVAHPAGPAGLPVAAARNHGAAVAIAAGADVLVFLDVDCVPDAALLGRLADTVAHLPDAVVSGVVTYLPPAPPGSWTAATLRAAHAPHPARPAPADGRIVPLEPALFWSLCFAVRVPLWQRIGGFYEGYVGYGAEDTDLGLVADAAGVALVMAGGADAFHLHHAVSDPPVEHLDDILRNSAVFARRHDRMPMRGWLAAFAARGLLDGTRTRRRDAPRVAAIPPRHPYVDAVTPSTVRPVDPGRVRAWEPDPLLDKQILERRRDEIDVVHLHFGYDHVDEAQLREWLEIIDRTGLRLVLTVHDLRNPHHTSPHRLDAQLRLLIPAADHVLTLTDAAADEIEQRYGRRPVVAPHPPVAFVDDPPPTAREHVLVPLKALRRNVLDPLQLVDAVRRGAHRAGLTTRVLVEPAAAEDPRLAGLDRLGVDVLVRPYLPHDDLCRIVAQARVCVLPYRFGTHSGWVELCRDLGTRVVAPDCGHYAAQWDEVITFVSNERDGLNCASLIEAVSAAAQAAPPARPDRTAREALHDQVVALHDAIYRQAVTRC